MSDAPASAAAREPAWARQLRRVLDAVALLALWLAGAMLAAILVLMNVEIATRYLFGFSTLIADEYAGYGFAALTMLGFTYAHRRRAFLRVDIAAQRLKGRAGRIVLGIAALLGAVVALFSAYVSYKTLSLSLLFNSTSDFASQTPLWIPQAFLPAGFAILGLSFLEEAVRRVLGLES